MRSHQGLSKPTNSRKKRHTAARTYQSLYSAGAPTNFDAIRLNTPDLQYSGMFNIEPIPSRYGLDLARKVVFANNAHYREQTFEDFMTIMV